MPAGARWGPKSGNANSLKIRELDLIVPTRDREPLHLRNLSSIAAIVANDSVDKATFPSGQLNALSP
jgi:hypothetical protein